jgi:dynein heavy chain
MFFRFKWLDVGVLNYNPQTKLYFVRAVAPGGIQHNVIPKGTQLNAYIKRDDEKSKAIPLPPSLTTEGCWIPRIRLMFCAEDPVVFADRVAYAYNLRLETEALLRYHLYVDCMPVDGVAELETCSLDRMVEWGSENSMLKKGPWYDDLSKNTHCDVSLYMICQRTA